MLAKRYVLAWAALSILLFSGCREGKSEEEHAEPNEPKPKACETFLPTTFRFSTIGLPGGSRYSVIWNGKVLRCEVSRFYGEPRIIKTVRPSAEQWRAFWQKMEEVKVWEWRVGYYTRAYDGVRWSLEFELGGRKVRASGSNAYPSDEDVTGTATIFEGSEVFAKFREAVRELVGE